MKQINNIQELAKYIRTQFQLKKRDSGESFYSVKDDSKDKEWIQDMCHEAHGSMMPDDYKYQFIVDALNAIEEYDDENESRDSLEADVYTSNLTAWLASHLERMEYVNDAVNEYGMSDFNLIQAMQFGQMREMYEVFDSVLSSLQDKFDEIESMAS
jgi:hypothetical protein